MTKSAVARRYAKALFDLLDAKSMEPSRTGLAELSQAMTQSPALKHVLASPAFSDEEKLSVLTALIHKLHCPPVMTSFLTQVVSKNRVTFLPDIAAAFASLVDQSRGTKQVAVTSAAALNATEQGRLRSRLRDLLRQEVEVTFESEPRLLGGLQIRIGSTLYDSTVRSRLNAMQTLLTKE